MSNQVQQKKPPTLVSRLEALEYQVVRFQMTENVVANLRQTTQTVVEMFSALVEELGGEELSKRIGERLEEGRRQKRKEEADRNEAALNQLIAAGKLEATDTVTEDSIVVGLESSPDGKIQKERLQLNFAAFNQDIKDELLGKQVGLVIKREEKEVFELQAIYKVKAAEPETVSEPLVEKKEAAPEAAAEPTASTPVEASATSTPPAPTEQSQAQ